MTEFFYPASTVPNALDIVWGRFYYSERPGVPGPMCHPCLVLSVTQNRPSEFAVNVVYGTSQIEKYERSQHFVISNATKLKVAGLNKETLFNLGRSAYLPWSDRWFEPIDERYPTPVMGHIDSDGAKILAMMLNLRKQHGLPVPAK